MTRLAITARAVRSIFLCSQPSLLFFPCPAGLVLWGLFSGTLLAELTGVFHDGVSTAAFFGVTPVAFCFLLLALRLAICMLTDDRRTVTGSQI